MEEVLTGGPRVILVISSSDYGHVQRNRFELACTACFEMLNRMFAQSYRQGVQVGQRYSAVYSFHSWLHLTCWEIC